MKTIEEICGPGWVDIESIEQYLRASGTTKTGNGLRENATDGEADWILTAPDGEEKSFQGLNYYSAASWEELLRWADSKKRN